MVFGFFLQWYCRMGQAAAWKSPNKIEVCAMPQDMIDAIVAAVATGREVIVRKERGVWVAIETTRRVVYHEESEKQ
jgi:hypothetical protein